MNLHLIVAALKKEIKLLKKQSNTDNSAVENEFKVLLNNKLDDLETQVGALTENIPKLQANFVDLATRIAQLENTNEK